MLGCSGVSYLWCSLEEAGKFLPVKNSAIVNTQFHSLNKQVSLAGCDANFAKFASWAQVGSLCSSTQLSLHNFLFDGNSSRDDSQRYLSSTAFWYNRVFSQIDINNQCLLLVGTKQYVFALMSDFKLRWLQVITL